jgi:hypothetical protein
MMHRRDVPTLFSLIDDVLNDKQRVRLSQVFGASVGVSVPSAFNGSSNLPTGSSEPRSVYRGSSASSPSPVADGRMSFDSALSKDGMLLVDAMPAPPSLTFIEPATPHVSNVDAGVYVAISRAPHHSHH